MKHVRPPKASSQMCLLIYNKIEKAAITYRKPNALWCVYLVVYVKPNNLKDTFVFRYNNEKRKFHD